jgi:hypothetical protein
MVIMTGEGDFELLDSERANLRKYVEGGGFLLASAGCSSPGLGSLISLGDGQSSFPIIR